MTHIKITYCTKCLWLTRAAWMAQELLSTFSEEIDELTLCPGREGGIFRITANDQLVWDRKEMGGFPQIKKLKQAVRDIIAPDNSLGHNDR